MSTVSDPQSTRETSAASSDYLTKEELRDRLKLESTRKVDELMKARKIPYMKLGHKTVRFRWSKVQEALSRYEIKAVE